MEGQFMELPPHLLPIDSVVSRFSYFFYERLFGYKMLKCVIAIRRNSNNVDTAFSKNMTQSIFRCLSIDLTAIKMQQSIRCFYLLFVLCDAIFRSCKFKF